jgi:hypothetical protein
VSVIKVDVEGAELRVLRGASKCIEALRPPWLIEWNAANLKANRVDRAAIFDFCRGAGYSIHAVAAFVKVDKPADLRLQMTRTESFVLWPEDPLPHALPAPD